MANQKRLFNPDNPPLAFSKEEGNAQLERIKADLAHAQQIRINMHNVRKYGPKGPGVANGPV